MSNIGELEYLTLLRDLVIKASSDKNLRVDRTGVGTYSTFGEQIRVALDSELIPLFTTKRLHFKSILVELLWFLRGDTNIKYLKENGVSIWDEWANEDGEIGPGYGKQWRRWQGVKSSEPRCAGERVEEDQILNVIASLKENPFSRRHIVSAWNAADIDDMALPPCHMMFQFYVSEDESNKYLSCHLYMRSCDIFLGLPFNIVSYALLTKMIAQQVNMEPCELVISFGDLHLYANHLEQAKEQLSRSPYTFSTPKLEIIKADTIDDYTLDNFKLGEYNSFPSIKAPIAV